MWPAGFSGRCPRALQPGQCGYCALSNFARNSHVNLSNIELASLELQRFWALLKVHAIELRAKFLERVSLVTCGRRRTARHASAFGLLCVNRAVWRAPTNFACNSSVTISGFELAPLELQRFWALLKVHAFELHATFLERVSLVTCGRRSRASAAIVRSAISHAIPL